MSERFVRSGAVGCRRFPLDRVCPTESGTPAAWYSSWSGPHTRMTDLPSRLGGGIVSRTISSVMYPVYPFHVSGLIGASIEYRILNRSGYSFCSRSKRPRSRMWRSVRLQYSRESFVLSGRPWRSTAPSRRPWLMTWSIGVNPVPPAIIPTLSQRFASYVSLNATLRNIIVSPTCSPVSTPVMTPFCFRFTMTSKYPLVPLTVTGV
mmetsp:Transcript_4638/g.14707  ORF Transcript_4638/g.14707 Transcript_4638/m.14707 type:complete len:206 (-) Transcript_4638:407-1024(-)